jgi:hypothetical protein
MLKDAPSEKPVISHYPPDFNVDLEGIKNQPGSRLCGPIFATSAMESQIIRLEGGDVSISLWWFRNDEYPFSVLTM